MNERSHELIVHKRVMSLPESQEELFLYLIVVLPLIIHFSSAVFACKTDFPTLELNTVPLIVCTGPRLH